MTALVIRVDFVFNPFGMRFLVGRGACSGDAEGHFKTRCQRPYQTRTTSIRRGWEDVGA